MAKPLARHADDAELNQVWFLTPECLSLMSGIWFQLSHNVLEKKKSSQWQKQRILADDPMAEYMMKQQEKASGRPARPRYQGPPAPPNRFEIQPGVGRVGMGRDLLCAPLGDLHNSFLTSFRLWAPRVPLGWTRPLEWL